MNVDDIIRESFRKVAAGDNKKGSFLTSFAQAVVRADRLNAMILKPVCITLIFKYGLCDDMERFQHMLRDEF